MEKNMIMKLILLYLHDIWEGYITLVSRNSTEFGSYFGDHRVVKKRILRILGGATERR